MIKKIIAGVVFVLVCFAVYVYFLPAKFEVSREITIQASPEVIFPYINHAEKSDAWMPWQESDPQMKTTYSGPAEGVGAASSWISEGPMGEGSSLITESVPNQIVKFKLVYKAPMAMEQDIIFTLTPKDNGTLVHWSVVGQNNFIAKFFSLFINLDKMIGTDFEKGLAELKVTAEADVQSEASK